MAREVEARCVGCGCTDTRACAGGCEWAMVDRFARIGVCSRCSYGKHAIALSETYQREVLKSRNTVATQ